jgi:hypothetical protein
MCLLPLCGGIVIVRTSAAVSRPEAPAGVVLDKAGSLNSVRAGRPLRRGSEEIKEHWKAPVDGKVVKVFNYGRNPFLTGQHRGVDFDAQVGTEVRSACKGKLAFAGKAFGQDHVVSASCGRWHVSYFPLAKLRVRSGNSIEKGEILGEVGRSNGHAGLHIGVRRKGERFEYVDPMSFFGSPPRTPITVVRTGRRAAPDRGRPVAPEAVPHPRSGTKPEPLLSPGRRRFTTIDSKAVRASHPALPPRSLGTAPWPVWVGLGTFLLGVGGLGGVAIKRRSRASAARSMGVQRPTVGESLGGS